MVLGIIDIMNPYLIFYFLLTLFPLFHGDLDIRIEEATTAIQSDQNNDSLYLIRGTLYFQHQEFMKSIRDFEKVESLVGPGEVVYMSYAKSWFKLEKYEFALENINLALQLNDKNPVAYRLKAKVHMDQGQYEKAAQNFNLSLANTDKIITESYLEVAVALDSLGSNESIEKSIHILNRGRKELADLDIFKNMIVDQYTKLENFDAAIKLQTEIIHTANRKERHYYKRAQLYERTQNKESALVDIKHSYDEMSNLPARYIRSKPMDDLRNELLILSQIIKSE